MAQKRSQRIGRLVALAQMQEKILLQQMGMANQRLTQSKKRASDLLQYKSEYRQLLQQKMLMGTSTQEVLQFELFLEQLDVAMVTQQDVIRKHQASFEQAKQQWQGQHSRSKVLDSVRNKYAESELKLLEKQQAASIDDAFNARNRKN